MSTTDIMWRDYCVCSLADVVSRLSLIQCGRNLGLQYWLGMSYWAFWWESQVFSEGNKGSGGIIRKLCSWREVAQFGETGWGEYGCEVWVAMVCGGSIPPLGYTTPDATRFRTKVYQQWSNTALHLQSWLNMVWWEDEIQVLFVVDYETNFDDAAAKQTNKYTDLVTQQRT